MKLTLDPMPQLRKAKEEAINRSFSLISSEQVHRDMAHALKRVQARTFLDGGTVEREFTAEAELRGMTTEALAELVLSKSNDLAARELRRQKLIMAVSRAQTPEELERVSRVLED